MTPDQPTPPPAPPAGCLREVAALFTRLGFTAFGGPAAHVALMEDEVVRRRGWVDRQHFLDLVAALNFIPGPNSTELAIHLGQIRAGWRGLVTAGVCFITPAVLIILPLAWAYVRLGHKPQAGGAMRGVSAAVVAIILVAGWRFARTGIKDYFTAAVAALSVGAEFLLRKYTALQSEIVILACAALAGVVWYARPKGGPVPVLALLPGITGSRFVTRTLAVGSGGPGDLPRLAWFFLKVGATLFGSGYVLVSYLQTGLVDQRPWLSQQELLDAIAVGQVTPGPLLTTATFIGYLLGHHWLGGAAGGVLGAVVATVAIFLPSFVLVAGFGRVLPRVRANRYAHAALDGMNAAVVALIFVTAARFAYALRSHPALIALAVACLAALLWTRVNATWLILAAGVIGWAASAAGMA